MQQTLIQRVSELYRQRDAQIPLRDASGEIISRLDYFKRIENHVTEKSLDNISKYIDRGFGLVRTIVYILIVSQEHYTLSSRNVKNIPAYYYVTISRRINQIGIKATMDEILGSPSIRTWSMSVPEMSVHVKSRKMDMARQENERVKVAGIKCGKCKSTNTVATSKQTRGGDEQETAFIKCIDCNEKWVAD